MIPVIVLAAAYLIGAIPFGYLLVKMTSGKDVRMAGSGNIGATNVLRTTGRTLGVVTLLLDIGKGALAVWIADRLTGGSPLWMSAAALAVMAGHAFPVFFGFRGGKAVASFVGAFLYLTPDTAAANTRRVRRYCDLHALYFDGFSSRCRVFAPCCLSRRTSAGAGATQRHRSRYFHHLPSSK